MRIWSYRRANLELLFTGGKLAEGLLWPGLWAFLICALTYIINSLLSFLLLLILTMDNKSK